MSMRVAVVGATGAVGSTMLEVMGERSFPADEVVPLASARSAGKKVAFAGSQLEVRELSDKSIDGFDVALFSAGGGVSREWAPKFKDAGCVVVDNSSAWRMEPNVPLVVAEVNGDALDRHEGIVANPNCSTMQMVMGLKPILDAVGIERVIVSTYQSTSGTGQRAVEELHSQAQAVLGKRQIREQEAAGLREHDLVGKCVRWHGHGLLCAVAGEVAGHQRARQVSSHAGFAVG